MTSGPDHSVDAPVEDVVVETSHDSEEVRDDEIDEETKAQLDDDGTLVDTREVVDSLLEDE